MVYVFIVVFVRIKKVESGINVIGKDILFRQENGLKIIMKE